VITFAKALGLPSCRHGPAGPSKAMKTRGFEALLPSSERLARGPVADQGIRPGSALLLQVFDGAPKLARGVGVVNGGGSEGACADCVDDRTGSVQFLVVAGDESLK
jgi:hypothetical protein